MPEAPVRPTPRSRAVPLSVLGSLLLLIACGGGGTGPSEDDGDDPQRAILPNPAFAANIQEIFDRRGCSASNCHGAAEQAGLRLTAGDAYGELVNVPATSEPLDRVVPGDAENSYLVVKVEGRQSVGSRMPLNGAPLDSIDRTNLRNWIDNGAPNN